VRIDNSGWIKAFSPNTSPDWNWATWFEPPLELAVWPLSAGTHTFQISGRSKNFRIDRIHLWLDGTQIPQNLAHPESFCSPWVVLGQGTPGTGGVTPSLQGSGSLEANTSMALSLAQARPNAAATLVIGFNQISAPFKGGVMVPDADLLLSGLVTGAAGTLVIGGTWPAGVPAGFNLWWQYWIVDPVATDGLSASNGLKSTTP
jgi:hypothetical protein